MAGPFCVLRILSVVDGVFVVSGYAFPCDGAHRALPVGAVIVPAVNLLAVVLISDMRRLGPMKAYREIGGESWVQRRIEWSVGIPFSLMLLVLLLSPLLYDLCQ